MRISDWSSDVCSSDLRLILRRPLQRRRLGEFRRKAEGGGGDRRALQEIASVDPRAHPQIPGLVRANLIAAAHNHSILLSNNRHARKSVVKGKRGSGRVDHQSRGLIKKKKTKT